MIMEYDHWTVNLTSPSCGTTGVAEVSDLPRTIDRCPLGFDVVLHPIRLPQILCADCRTVVYGPQTRGYRFSS
jgi:hypothetical protein